MLIFFYGKILKFKKNKLIKIKNGVEIKDVVNILGNRKIETTENYYISSSAKSVKIASEKF